MDNLKKSEKMLLDIPKWLLDEEISHFDLDDHGAYFLLCLNLHWAGGFIEFDENFNKKLSNFWKISQKKSAKKFEKMKKKFNIKNGILTHSTITKDLQTYIDKQLMFKDRAKTAADKRWGNDATSIPQAMLDPCLADATSIPNTITNTNSILKRIQTTTNTGTLKRFIKSFKNPIEKDNFLKKVLALDVELGKTKSKFLERLTKILPPITQGESVTLARIASHIAKLCQVTKKSEVYFDLKVFNEVLKWAEEIRKNPQVKNAKGMLVSKCKKELGYSKAGKIL